MEIDRFFSVFKSAARGMEAQRTSMGASADNIANAATTRTADGTPYALKRAVHEAGDGHGTRFQNLLSRMSGEMQTAHSRHIPVGTLRPTVDPGSLAPITDIEELEDYRMEYDPTHPHADELGYVYYPEMNVVEEMTRMMSANRIYEANLTAVSAAREIIKRTLEI